LEYWLEGVRGRNHLDVVHHKSHGHGVDGAGVVHIVEVGVRYGEIAGACGGGDDDDDARVAANPYEAIGWGWGIPQNPFVALVLYVPAGPADAAVHTPILSAASVYHDRPNAMTAVIRMLE
jgi:hypothetical protein